MPIFGLVFLSSPFIYNSKMTHNFPGIRLYHYIYNYFMKQQFAATLTGSDYPVDGTVQIIDFDGFSNAYEFESIDNSLHLIIARDDEGKWVRLAGTEPYLGSWIDELAQQVV